MANLEFHSTSYQWLVVAGAKAQYKGSGTMNGSGEYGFLLTAAIPPMKIAPKSQEIATVGISAARILPTSSSQVLIGVASSGSSVRLVFSLTIL
jgi:hypothetical protein